jgi:hypothetical protein
MLVYTPKHFYMYTFDKYFIIEETSKCHIQAQQQQ